MDLLKKTIKNRFLIGVMFVLGLLTVCLSLFTNISYADAVSFSQLKEIDESQLVLGETIVAPVGMFDNKVAELNVLCPDGSILLNPSEIKLVSAGQYKLIYTANINGKYFAQNRSFLVENTLYSVSGNTENSFIEYSMNEQTNRKGLNVRLAKGNTFYFHEAINLWDTSEDNPAVMFSVPLSNEREYDATKINLRFTDAYDKSNYFSVKVDLENNIWSHIKAGAVGQLFGGYDNSTSSGAWSTTYGSVFNMYHSNSFSNEYLSIDNILAKQQLSIWYDEEDNSAWMSYYHFSIGEKIKSKLCDFDEVTEQTNPWVGFKQGTAFLSIDFDRYINDKANIQLMRIGSSLLNAKNIDDKFKTQIAPNIPKEGLVNGSVGYYYPIPTAVASNVYFGGIINYTTKVLFGYKRNDGIYNGIATDYGFECNVINGYFNTPYCGRYAICYRAYDRYGNITERVVTVEVVNEVSNLGEIRLEESQKEAEEGNIVNLAKYSLSSGGLPPFRVEITATQNGNPIEVLGGNKAGRYIIPKTAGIYQIKYTIYDYICNMTEKTYNITVAKPTAPSFSTEADLPKYFIEDTNYVLPELLAVDYRTNKKVVSTIEISDGNGNKKYVADSQVMFKADAKGNVVIKYCSETNSKTYTIPVIKVLTDRGNIDFTKYFVYENVNAVCNSLGIEFTATQNGSFSFIRDITAFDLKAELKLKGLGTQFNTFRVTLQDSKDADISINYSFDFNGTNVVKSINGTRISSVALQDNILAGFTLLSKNNSLMIGDTYSLIKNTDSGDVFNGFPSGRVYIKFEFENVSGTAVAELTTIKNQKFNSDITSDRIKPTIYNDCDYKTVTRSIGEIVHIPKVIADDVLSGYTSVALTVKEGDKIVSSTSGVLLNGVKSDVYDIKIESIAVYSITYTAVDWQGKEYIDLMRIYVLDETPPKIMVSQWENSFVLGNITMPNVTATDDITIKPTIYMTLFAPNGNIYNVNNGIFNASVKGSYVLRITAFDEIGNTTIVEKQFDVK